MIKVDPHDADRVIKEINRLQQAGCDLVRMAVPDQEACRVLGVARREISIPIVADVHFDYKLALLAMEEGADKVRINPGNIGGGRKIQEVARAAKDRGVPIRVGVNSGSVDLKRYRSSDPQSLVQSALDCIHEMEEVGFFDIVVSLKAPDVQRTVQAYRLMAEKTPYPFHLGVTEAGPLLRSSIKSAIGIGVLLDEGIGDTIRVSITGDSVDEVRVGREILRSLSLRPGGLDIISCPTCGRCKVPLLEIVGRVERELSGLGRDLKVAIMGCTVNGPGEAREADVGVAFGSDSGLLFRKGEVVKKVRSRDLEAELLKEVERFT
jgi:(E)-4-hydroxy-3-methylbut-2-enyl-diphosphate synthase